MEGEINKLAKKPYSIPNITEFKVPEGNVYQGNNTDAILFALREDGYSLDQIADWLGCSKNNIFLRLKKHSVSDKIKEKVLGRKKRNPPKKFNKSDYENALLTNTPFYTVVGARQSTNQKPNIINISIRRRALVRAMFGSDYLPGDNFLNWLRDQSITIGDKLYSEPTEKGRPEIYARPIREMIMNFYIMGRKVDQKERHLRLRVIEALKEITEETPEELLEKGVLCLKKSSSN